MAKYVEVYEQLKQKILDKTYPEKSYLPSEDNLAVTYQVSRETLRKSLQLLSNEGYVQKQPKKGNMVLGNSTYTLSATQLSSFKEFSAAQPDIIESQTSVLTFKTVPCPNFLKEDTAEYARSEMYSIVRQRRLNGESVIIDKDYIVESVIPSLSEEIAQKSIYDYIENTLKLAIGYAKREIKVEAITKEDKKYMDLSPSDTHVVVVKSRVYLADSRFFQYTESRHRLDKFKILEFAKRRNRW